MRKPYAILLQILVLSGLVYVSVMAGGVLEKSFTVGSDNEMVIRSEYCDIDIKSENGSEVRIKAECEDKIDEYYDFEIRQNGKTVEISAYLCKDEVRFFGLVKDTSKPRRKLHLTVSVPGQYNLDIKNSRGDVTLAEIDGEVAIVNSRGGIICSDVSGSLEVCNSRGDIELSRIEAPIEASNSRGSINVRDSKGNTSLNNSRSDITVANLSGNLRAGNSRGRISVVDLDGSIEAWNSRGGIDIALTGQPEKDCSLSNSRGNIELALPDGCGFNISAEVSRGSIGSDVPLTVSGELGDVIRDAKLAGGGPNLHLRNSRGNIKITGTGKEQMSDNFGN